MSKYLDSLGPEAKLGEVFQDLYGKAVDAIGPAGDALSFGSSVAAVPDTELVLKMIGAKSRRFRNTQGSRTILLMARQGEEKFATPLITVAEREELMYGRGTYSRDEVGAAGLEDALYADESRAEFDWDAAVNGWRSAEKADNNCPEVLVQVAITAH